MSASGSETGMTFAPGDTLGPYEIISALGEGGMGEVYRARDRKLHRDVAIKVLPDSLSADPDRVARFERESHVLASLNHPNIAHIYGVEETNGIRALVLELVEGPTLAERIAHGALSVDEALQIARQIAEALEAAHDLGIIHRDLKPANVKLRPDGTVKVLDFGLAKALEPASGTRADITASPTIMTPSMTRMGIVLGTVGYMSPEQARGESVDKRADIWAFGVVMFEMLTGGPLFARQTVADTVAAVLDFEPDWSRVPANARPMLQACLRKDPKHRLRDIADAQLLLDSHSGPETSSASQRVQRSWLAWSVAAIGAIAAAVFVWAPWRTSPPAAEPIRFQVSAPGDLPASAASAISPNGRYLAFLSSGSDRVIRVWVRDLTSSEDRPLQGTEIGQAAAPPFWSPDSRFIGYDAGGALKKIEVSGGLAQTICELPQPAVGGTWNREGVILFGTVSRGIMRVPDTGGVPSAVTLLDETRHEGAHLTPAFLPDGHRFFYLRVSRTHPEGTGIFLGSLEVRPEEQSAQRLVATTTSPIYARGTGGRPGKLLFLRDGNLMAQTFDERRLELSGAPIIVSERVHSYLDTATVSVSDNDTLVYKSATQNMQLMWVDRQGRPVGRVSDPGLYGGINLSPDATQAVVVRVTPQITSNATLWLLDLASGASSRFASTAGGEAAIWSPDGSRIAFTSGLGSESAMIQKPTGGNGEEEQLFRSAEAMGAAPTSWSRDGRHILYVMMNPKTSSDLWVLSLDGTAKPVPFLRSEAAESQAQFSPDAQGSPRWVAFTSNESGRDEVQLRTFPDAQSRLVVSSGGGHSPRWRKDGKELFYVAADGMVMSAAISDSPFRVAAATPLFRTPPGFSTVNATGRRGPAPWDVAPDGQRFLFVAPVEASGTSQFTVVLNWQNGLTK
jgi:eukaryotic-like serine/threonine-protein kinase